jgi:hypothetical protein
MYIKNGLDKLIDFMIEFIVDVKYRNQYGSVCEMRALHAFHNKYKALYLLPICFNRPDIPIECYENYNKFNNTVFDSSTHGIKLCGRDRYHKKPLTDMYLNELDKSITYKWEANSDGLLIPYLQNPNTNEWLLINNLHIHSKDLFKCLSKSMIE